MQFYLTALGRLVATHRLFLFVIICSVSSFCIAEPIERFQFTGSPVNLNQYTHWLFDQTLQVEDVIDGHWRQEPNFFARLGSGATPVWLRFGVENKAQAAQELLLHVHNVGFRHVHLFIHNRVSGEWESLVSGDSQFLKLRALGHRHALFPLSIAPNSEYDVYARFSALGGQPVEWELQTYQQFESERELGGLKVSLFLGLILGFIACYCLAFLMLKRKQYLACGVFAGGLMFVLLCSTGTGFQLFWQNTAIWQLYGQFFSGLWVLLSAIVLIQMQSISPSYPTWFSSLLKLTSLGCFLSLGLLWIIPFEWLSLLRPAPFVMLMVISLSYLQNLTSSSVKSPTIDSYVIGPIFFVTGLLYCLDFYALFLSNEHYLFLCSWTAQLGLLLWAVLMVYRLELLEQVEFRFDQMKKTFEQESFEQQLLLQTLYDSVTSFPNRIALLNALESLIDNNSQGEFSVFLIDTHGITEIINTLGHHNGDELFKRVARRVDRLAQQYVQAVNLDQRKNRRSVLSIVDTRVMALIYVGPEGRELSEFGKNLVRSLSYPFEFKRMTLDISAHVGVAKFPTHGQSAAELLQYAYVAAELAKEKGELVLQYDSQTNPYSARRLTLVSELTSALRLELLELYYQPQIDIRQNSVIGFEALLRWQHPQYGFVSPAEFIPLAEKTGVINQLTMWVIENSLQQSSQWLAKGLKVRISVNLSARNLQSANLPDQIDSLMNKHQVPPHLISLEITETAMMLDPASAVKVVTQLHELGLRISVDDFGMGYSSLAYLKRMPVSEIKVDRAFVREMCDELNDQIIVNTTLNMGHNLGLEIVAEGVEDERTLLTLKRLGCDFAQGYFIAKPMPAQEVDHWLSSCPYKVLNFDDDEAATA